MTPLAKYIVLGYAEQSFASTSEERTAEKGESKLSSKPDAEQGPKSYRFDIISEGDLERYAIDRIPVNTRENIEWSLRLFYSWREEINQCINYFVNVFIAVSSLLGVSISIESHLCEGQGHSV